MAGARIARNEDSSCSETRCRSHVCHYLIRHFVSHNALPLQPCSLGLLVKMAIVEMGSVSRRFQPLEDRLL
jgi:hypothetical protein